MRGNGRPGKRSKGNTSLRPRYRGREEVPVLEFKFEDHDGRWYGSGRVVFDSLSMPMTIRLPWNPALGQWSYKTSVPGFREAFMALKKIDTAFDAKAARGTSVADSGVYPQILEYLSQTTYPDGSKRETSSLVVLCDGASWRVCLSDRDNQRVMWKTGATLVDALEAVELSLLGDDPSDWRRSADASGGRKKRS